MFKRSCILIGLIGLLAVSLYGCSDGTSTGAASGSNQSQKTAPSASQGPDSTNENGDEIRLSIPHAQQIAYFQSQFTIYNIGTQPTHFVLTVNNSGPHFNLLSLVNALHRYPDEYPGEPLYRKAWRFATAQNTHYLPLGMPYLQNQALLYLNSNGFGFCSDSATVLAQVWQLLGYPARVWGLDGHVVPEVFADGVWHMLDPDLRVYYVGSTGGIASVNELEEDPSLITSPIQMLDGADPAAYSEYVADIYASADDNAPYPDSIQPLAPQDFNLFWTLPPGSALTMPLPTASLQTMYEGELDPEVAEAHLAVLSLPTNWEGVIDMPLIVYDITGSGEVTITDVLGQAQSFVIGSAELEQFINARTVSSEAPYFRKLHISATGQVKVSYFINAKALNLTTGNNELRINGFNVGNLSILTQ